VRFIDDLGAILPRRRDDEPPELRAQIVKELRDHLECAYQRELLKTGDEVQAAQRVEEQFGDARQLARKLWFEAMQEKIMSQRILVGLSATLAVACLAIGGFALRIAQQTAEASAAATRALVDQGQETNQALLKALDRLVPRPEPAKPPESEEIEETGEIRFKLVKGVPGGPPAAGYEINFDRGVAGLSNELGELVVDKVRAGMHTVSVTTPWGETAKAWRDGALCQFNKRKSITDEIVCPAAPLPEFDVTLDVQWPADLRGEHLGLLVSWSKTREYSGIHWWLPTKPDEESKCAIVTTDRMTLYGNCKFNWSATAFNEPQLMDFRNARANPHTTIRYRGADSRFHLSCVVILAGEHTNGEYLAVRTIQDSADDVDPTEISVQLTPDQANQHISIPIPPEVAANVRRALGRSFNLTAEAPANPQREQPEDKPDPAAIDKRIAQLTDLIRSEPSGARLIRRSDLWREKGDFAKAIEDISEAIRLHPRVESYYYLRISLWREMHDVEKELADLAAIISFKPDDNATYCRRAEIWEQKGEFQKAIGEYTTLIQQVRDNPDLYMARGHLSQKAHDPANALLDYIEALARGPESADAHSKLAWFFATAADAKYRNAKRSLKLATEACRLAGWRDWKALSALAAAHAESGDFEPAVTWQAKALEMNGKALSISDTEIKSAESRLELYKAGKPWRDPE